MMELLLPLVGASVLLLLAVDLFVTVFHPEGHGGPLTQRHNGAVWGLWKKAAPSGKRRDGWLGLGGPVLAVLTPAIWALLLVAGFALIYYPWMERFLVSPGTLRVHWVEALYFSGFAAATLGTGDIVPDLAPLRLLSIVQALSGFALLSASLTYILAVYRENGRKTTLASELALHYRRGDAGAEPSAVAEEPELWLKHVVRELLHVTQAHAQYPILHYFRPSDAHNSLALQLEPLVRMSGSGGLGSPAGDQPGSSEAALVSDSLDRYLTAADRRFVRSPSGEAGGGSLDDRYRRLLDYLGYSR